MLPPETASKLGDFALGLPMVGAAARPSSGLGDPRLRITLAGLELPSPLGAAAGIDKECRTLPALLNLGFGFATAGTVTLAARPGNAKPRLIRDVQERSLVNAMGFPGPGLDVFEPRLRNLRHVRGRTLVSVSGTIEEEVFECHRRLQPLASGVELNVSSPNTTGLRIFHEPARLRSLVEVLAEAKTAPLFVKLPPWSREAGSRRHALFLAETAVLAGADGLVIANTHPVDDARLAVGRGGLSGAPLFEHTRRMVAEVRAALPEVALIGCGGVSSARDVWELMSIGANAVQLYTAFIYEGPNLPARINFDLISMMEWAGVRSPSEIAGAPPQA